jgi:hypothetical protein
MNVSVTITAAAIAASFLIMLLAWTASASVYEQGARSLRGVELIGLDTNICAMGITDHMVKEGFLVTDRAASSDAVLEVNVLTDGSLADHGKIEKARYSAVLVGEADRVLFATGGDEEAPDLENLCEDIGDDIADQLNNRMGG